MTGKDLIEQLNGKINTEILVVPSVMLRHEQDKFLDDITIEQVEKELNVNVEISSTDGYELLCNMLGCD